MSEATHVRHTAEIHRTLDNLQALTPMPEALVKLLEVIDHPDTPSHRIAEIVAADPALSLGMLRLVNSAAFGLSRQVTSVADAIHFLGLNETKNMAIALAVKTGLIGGPARCNVIDRKSCWKHLVAVAVGTDAVARHLEHEQRPSAFAAGLFHDIGVVLIDRALPGEMGSIVERLRDETVERNSLEREVLGFTHGDVGAWLGEKWGIPKVLVRPMLHHDRPWDADGDEALCTMVHVADRVAQRQFPHLDRALPIQPEPAALALLGLEPPFLEALRSDLGSQLVRMAQLLKI